MDKYLVISSEFPPGPGGIGKHAYSFIKSLTKYNIGLDVICDMDYASEDEIKTFIANLDKAITVHRIKRKGILTYIDRIVKSLVFAGRGNYKKIIVTGKFPIWIGGLIKFVYGKKVMIDCFIHGSEVNLSSKIQRRVLYACLKKMDKIWAVSRFTQSLLPANLANLSTTALLPNGLNIEDWPIENRTNPLNWGGNPRLLTVGSISLRKGQHCVIKSLPAAIKDYPGIHYHIVGLAKDTAYIEQLADDLGVREHITIHGKYSQDDLIKAYQSADIFCMLSENQANGDVEGFGIAILEANIMGLPVIGSAGCGIEDAIEDGFNGYLIDSDDSTAFVNAIAGIVHSNADELKDNCISWAKKHNWDLLVKKII